MRFYSLWTLSISFKVSKQELQELSFGWVDWRVCW